jgi:NTP pyrophosphatase (non-canonical NTP hydrolase)
MNLSDPEFIAMFAELSEQIYQNAIDKDFYGPDQAMAKALAGMKLGRAWEESRDALRLDLIHSELSEALEAIRHGNPPDQHCPEFSGLEIELADAVIRIMDLAAHRKLRLAEAILAKHEHNKSRPRMHGGKRF